MARPCGLAIAWRERLYHIRLTNDTRWNIVPKHMRSGAVLSFMGTGAVAIWNDITPEGRANFYEWHGRQHIPERVSIPGFQSGRRYIAKHGSPEYFTLYETDGPEVLRSEEYAQRLNAPTDWTLKSTSHFRNVARALAEVAFTAGSGSGGLIATWRCVEPRLTASQLSAHLEFLPKVNTWEGVAGVHLLISDFDASSVDNEERKRRGEPNTVPAWILMVEGWCEGDAFERVCEQVTAFLQGLAPAGAGPIEHGVYVLQSSLTKAELQP